MSTFDIHLLIMNETEYTFDGSYAAKSGKGVNFPTIQPGSASGVITARQEIEGAEGTFTLTCNGSFEDQNDARLIFFADDPHLGKNKFRLIESSPFLKLKLRFGNSRPTLDEKWGTSVFPTSGHPLGIKVTITPQPVIEQLSLLTYNTHLFEGSLGGVGGKLAHKKTVFEDDARRKELLKRISELQPDIVCLQEVWAIKMRKLIARELCKIYPHVYIVPGKGSHGIKKRIENAVTAAGGLMVASRYPIQDPCFQMYTGLHKTEDKWAKKGALTFSISFPISPTKSTTVKIGTTHCPTDIEDAQKAVETLAGLTFGSGENDGIVAGDFNLHIETTPEYAHLNQTMVEHRADDIVYRFKPNLEDSFTDWRWGNALSKALKHKGSTDKKDRIDYVYFAPGSKSNHLKPMGADVFHDWKVGNELDVSDHYPVLVKFSVS